MRQSVRAPRVASAIVVIFASSVLTTSASSQVRQPARTIELQSPSCTNCVRIIKVATLGDEGNDGALRGNPRNVVRDSKGRLLVADENGGAPQVYDATGRFVKMLGRRGSGPGEFQHAGAIVPLADGRVAVFDIGLSRLNLFDANLAFQSSRPTKIRTADARSWRGDTILTAAPLNTPASFGYPFHFTTLVEEGPLSFSFEPLGIIPRNEAERWKSAIVGNRFCVSRERRLAVTCSTSTSDRPTEYRYVPNWFKDGAPLFTPGDVPPTAVFKAMVPLSDNQIALAILVPDPKFRDAQELRRTPEGEVSHITRLDGYYDTMILIIDLSTNRLLGVTRHPQALMYNVGRGEFASVDEDEGIVTIWRIALSR